MTISLIFLSACQSNNLSFVGEQCQAVIDDGEGNSYCRCRTYYVNRDFIGSKGTIIRKPLIYCNGIMGYSVKDNERYVNFLQAVRLKLNIEEKIYGDE